MERQAVSFKGAVVLTLISFSRADASDFGAAGDTVASTCKEAEFFATTKTWLYRELQTKYNAISTMEAEKQKYELAAAAAVEPVAANRYKALAIFTALCQQRAIAQYHNKVTAVNDYAARASAWAGLLVGQAVAADVTYKQTGTATESGTNSKATLQLTPEKPATNTCFNSKVEAKMTDGAELELRNIKKIRITPDKNILKPQAALNIELQATTNAADTYNSGTQVFDSSQSVANIVKTHASAGNQGFKILTKSTTAQTYGGSIGVNLGMEEAQPENCIKKPPEDDKLIPTNNQMRYSLCTALNALKDAPTSPATGKISLLTTDPDFKKIAASILLTTEQQSQQKGKTDTTLIEQKIKDLYGPTDAEFTTTYITNIVNQNIQYLNNGQNAQKTIAQLAGSNEAVAALSYLLREKEVTVKENSPKTQKHNCKPRTKSECQPEIGCKWEGNDENGECKAKGGEGQTNTAGAGEGAAGEQKKEEKCKGKLEDACKKDTGCKWERKECKDSSFLVNEKLDMSMAAFVSIVT
uniref:Variant surface glycoprotein 1125.138 n=1 Tax=Trypanosoma brucei TaxID=5691 RepID=A0A1J0R5B2_9TRYP|nr:variant surface glycoprotein 1125.138 [Trypanosoma brucei]